MWKHDKGDCFLCVKLNFEISENRQWELACLNSCSSTYHQVTFGTVPKICTCSSFRDTDVIRNGEALKLEHCWSVCSELALYNAGLQLQYGTVVAGSEEHDVCIVFQYFIFYLSLVVWSLDTIEIGCRKQPIDYSELIAVEVSHFCLFDDVFYQTLFHVYSSEN